MYPVPDGTFKLYVPSLPVTTSFDVLFPEIRTKAPCTGEPPEVTVPETLKYVPV